jgi:hypothetical protein
MRTTIRPETPGCPPVEVEPDLLRGPRVRVEGALVVPRRERGRPTFPIPLADGTERPLTLHSAFMGLRARIDDREYPVEPRLTLLELLLVVLPLAFLTVLPPIGAILGAAGVMVARLAVRSPYPPAVRLGATAGVSVAGVVILALLGARP